jgi:hypothetical protein
VPGKVAHTYNPSSWEERLRQKLLKFKISSDYIRKKTQKKNVFPRG